MITGSLLGKEEEVWEKQQETAEHTYNEYTHEHVATGRRLGTLGHWQTPVEKKGLRQTASCASEGRLKAGFPSEDILYRDRKRKTMKGLRRKKERAPEVPIAPIQVAGALGPRRILFRKGGFEHWV